MLHSIVIDQRMNALSPSQRQLADRLEPVLSAIASHPEKRLLIAIDGPCGSGKTTLAALLSQLLDCPCVHMDDFHIPHARKTEERLSQPGGNADRERLMADVLLPWKQGENVSYQPYDCAADCLAAPVELPASPILILEGSYSHYPDIAGLTDIRVFVHVSKDEQLRRIDLRCPEKLPMFISRWIPLEEAYFRAFSLPDESAIIIGNQSVQGM